MSSKTRARVLPGRHADVHAALQILPEAANCPRDLYQALLEGDGTGQRRVVVVMDRDEPLAVVAMRRRGLSWGLLTNWIVPGYLFPVKPGRVDQALGAINEPVFVSWWRQPQSPPYGLQVRGLKRVSTHGTPLEIDLDAIPVRPEVRAVCEHTEMDPYTSISEGTLIATVVPERAEAFLGALGDARIDAADVGEVVEATRGTALRTSEGERPLEHPGLDPFWGAFGRWAQEAAGIAEAG